MAVSLSRPSVNFPQMLKKYNGAIALPSVFSLSATSVIYLLLIIKEQTLDKRDKGAYGINIKLV